MNIRNQLEYTAVAGLLGLCRILPESALCALYRSLGRLAHAILVSRRKLALQNVALAFPEKPLADRKRIVRQHFINLSEAMALNTLIMSGRITNSDILEIVETENLERFQAMAAAADHGLLLFSAHLGNWELMPQYLTLNIDKNLHVIARKSNNPLLEERVIRPLRERFGVSVFYKKNAMMNMVKAARKGDIIGVMIDQRLNIKQGIPVKFFGREAGTTATPALLQLRFGIPTVSVFMVRTGTRKYRLLIGDPVSWEDNGKPMEEQVAELTAVHQKIIEDTIRQYPEQWFWVHDRWGLNKGKR
jgi:KDO2-lipid IV(A) lauroyltransferase